MYNRVRNHITFTQKLWTTHLKIFSAFLFLCCLESSCAFEDTQHRAKLLKNNWVTPTSTRAPQNKFDSPGRTHLFKPSSRIAPTTSEEQQMWQCAQKKIAEMLTHAMSNSSTTHTLSGKKCVHINLYCEDNVDDSVLLAVTQTAQVSFPNLHSKLLPKIRFSKHKNTPLISRGSDPFHTDFITVYRKQCDTSPHLYPAPTVSRSLKIHSSQGIHYIHLIKKQSNKSYWAELFSYLF